MPNSEEPFRKIDVPADGSCLFWAVALAYLTPVKNNDALFQQRYKALFGDEKTATQNLNHVRNLVQNYDMYDDTFVGLVRNTFRNRIVDHIRSRENEFRAFVEGESGRSFDDYLQDMRNSNTWGGEPEIRAMSEMLGAKISVSGATTSQYDNGNIQIQLFHVGAPGARNHYNFGLERDIVNDNGVVLLQNNLQKSIEHYQGRPQDFELIELLIKETDSGTGTSTQQKKDFKSFQARFQSYIDQIPSYLHSVEKAGFFPHFFLGSFSTLLDTEVAKKLDIGKIYFDFDGAKTLKVAVIKNGEISSRKDVIDKVKLFVISESGSRPYTQEFDQGELQEVLGEHYSLVEDNLGEIKVKFVEINKDNINDQGISVTVKDKKVDIDHTSERQFTEIKKGLWDNPEGDIAKLTHFDVQEVRGPLGEILKKISAIHSEYESSLEYASRAREAAHHGFIAGALNNFRYRYNLRVYLEQFGGRGYTDVVLLARGPDRALNSVPIIIELKAGRGPNLTPDKALEQAEKYAQGFQPNVQRVLTTADNILFVGVNLDYSSPVSNIEIKSREERIIPLFQDMLESVDDWYRGTEEINKRELKKQIKNNLERIYHTFPGTPEKGDNHYFSRFLLGQSLLFNEALGIGFEKHIFIYGKDESIPTEARSRVKGGDRAAKKKADEKLAESSKLDESHAVVSMVLIPESTEKLVYVINIVEANRKDVLDKVLPLDKLSKKIEGREIVELNLNFDTRYKSNFGKYLTVEASDPVSLEQYNERGIDEFQGTFKNIPYPNELKEAFDKALDSQRTQFSMGEYNELFKRIGEGIWPFKTLIGKETNFQGVLHGAFSYYSDLKLQELPETRALVLTEFQTGRGERIDMLVHGIKFEGDAKEYTPIGLELKASRQGKGAKALLKEANDQINKEYKEGVTYKTLTDGDEVKFISVVFNKGAKDADSLIPTSKEFIPVKVVHSSTHVLPKVEGLRTLESATAEKDYYYRLQRHDVADIARIEYNYEYIPLKADYTLVEIANELQQFQDQDRETRAQEPLTLIVDLNNKHWVTLVIVYQNEQYHGYYADSLGGNVPDNIHQVLQQGQVTVHDVSVAQQTDYHNNGLWALENVRDINAVLQESRSRDVPIVEEIHKRLQVQGRDENYFIRLREDVSDRLSIDPQRIANLEAVLARRESNLNSCVKQGSRSRRNVNPCLFSKDDVEKFSKGKVDESNVDKIIIDSEKFLTYVKSSQNEGKNAQLIEFIRDKNIGGDYKYLVDKVIQDQGYERYIQNERINGLYGYPSQQNSGLTKNPKLKSSLINAAGRIQLIRGMHGAIVSCKDGTATDCGLNIGGIAWSFASQPIEDVMVKITPKLVKPIGSIVGKVIPGTLGKQTKFAIRVVGVKFGTTVAKGIAGTLIGVPDIVEIGMSASNLVDCKNRENSDNPCGEKEIRDNIASISFSGVSFVSGIALTAASMPGIGIAVGAGLMVGYGVYSGVSNIIEYEKKYDTTHDENWRIFWHTFAFQPIPVDVQHLATRQDMVNSLAQEAWKALNNGSLGSIVAYGIGLGEVGDGALHPSNARIIMDREDADTESISRVIPGPIPNAKMICLPHITHADYEKGCKKSVSTAVHYCENAMVIADEKKDTQNGGTIFYNLRNINRGTVVGSGKLNNSFLIFEGTERIIGGNNTVNRFILINSNFSGGIVVRSNSTNVFDLSTVTDDIIKANIDYSCLESSISNILYSGALQIKINDHSLINECVSNNLNILGYHYIGRQNKVDKILCTGNSESPIGHNIMVNSGGGYNNTQRDTIENCGRVMVLPYTDIRGKEGNYTFYIKTAGYKGRDLHSEIDVKGTGTVIFPETDLLSDCDEVTYSSDNNTLSLKIGLDQNNQYTLDIKNYIEQSSDKPNFILIDKNGSNIVPKTGKSESSAVKINSFELYTEYSLDDFDAVENHYKKVLNNNKGYKVFGVVRNKVQSQNNSTVSHMMFGSSGDDIINFDQGAMFARGGNGSDIYVISSSVGKREVIIDNNSDDKKLDVLFIPKVPKEFSIQQRNLYLNYGDARVQVKNYLQDNDHRHLAIMNSKKETFIPYIQSTLHTNSSVKNGKLVPFFHATQTQNMFFLSKDFQYDRVVTDSRSEDIEQYKDKGDLLLMREGEVPFTMKIKGYFDDQSRWKDVNFHLWNNGNFSNFDLPQEIDEVMSYQDKLKADYEGIIKEYVIDFTQSLDIAHNQNDDLTSIGQDKERVGLMILKGITPGQVKVSSSGSDLVLHDTKSNRTINIKNWDSSESNRISTLEFDLGLDPIKIRGLDRFNLSGVAEIQALVNKASENYQNDVLTSVGQDEERVEEIILKVHITIDPVKVSSSGSDPVLRDTKSKEFDLDPIKFCGLDRFNLSGVAEIQALVNKALENYQNDTLTSVGQDEERVEEIMFKVHNITIDPVKVSSSGSDPVLCDTKFKEFDLGPIKIPRAYRFSLSSVAEMQALVNKALENYQKKTKYTTKVENDFKCLVSVNGFKNGNKTYECLGFSSLQDQKDFTEGVCSKEQIEEFKDKIPNNNQVVTLLEKLQNDLSLSGYDQSTIDQCFKLTLTSELEILKLLISKTAQDGKWDEVKILLDKTANRSNADIEDKNKWSKSWTLLHYAVYNGDLNLVKDIFELLLGKVGDINARDRYYWTPLHYAAYYNESGMVTFLIDKHASIETESKKSKTPMEVANTYSKSEVISTFINKAIEKGKSDVVKNFFKRNPEKFSVEDKDEWRTSWTLLHYAAYNGKLDIVQGSFDLLLEKSGGDINVKESQYDYTPLHYAVYYNRSEIVKLFLNKQANTEAEDKESTRPLHLAAREGYLDIVNLLLDKGADIKAKGKYGWTPLKYAQEENKSDVVQLLKVRCLYGYGKCNPMLYAIKEGGLDLVKILLSKASNIEARDRDGKTPLHYAVEYNKFDAIKLLIGHNAIDINVGSSYLETPLHIAAQQGCIASISLLLDNQAKIEAQDWSHKTPLHHAAYYNKPDAVKYLISRNANVNAKDRKGNVPAYYAMGGNRVFDKKFKRSISVQEDRLDVFGLLIDKTDIKIKNDDDKTLFHVAAEDGNLRAVRVLVNKVVGINS